MEPLEYADELSDVLTKASVPQEARADLQKVARDYQLNYKGLVELESSTHLRVEPEVRGLHRIIIPYGGFTVNVWYYLIGEVAIIADAGPDAGSVITALKSQGVKEIVLLITHAHPDHVGGREELLAAFPSVSTSEPIEVIETVGHSTDHRCYHLPDRAICFCGDALFAGSMGRPNVGYEQSVASVQRLMSLPHETVLLPGHGPATTVGRERKLNCFYA